MKKKITPKFIIKNLDAIVCGTTLTLCVILVNVNVFFRYFLNSPIKWTDEVVTSLFVWTVFMGSAYAHRRHAHLGVDIVVNLLHGRKREIVEFIMDVLQILVLVLLTYISAQYVCNLIWKRGIIFQMKDGVFTWGKMKIIYTETLRIPKWYTGIAVPIGFGLSLAYSVIEFMRDRLHILKPKADEQPAEIEEGGAY